MSLFGVKPPQTFRKLCAVYSLCPHGVFWRSLPLALWDLGKWMLTRRFNECCGMKARSTLGYLMLICLGLQCSARNMGQERPYLLQRMFAQSMDGSWCLTSSFQVGCCGMLSSGRDTAIVPFSSQLLWRAQGGVLSPSHHGGGRAYDSLNS